MKSKISNSGYVMLYFPEHPYARKNWVYEHRVIVECKIGRILKPGECIHHINEIKTDNNINNLMLFSNQAKHSSFHKKIIQFGMTNPIKFQIEHRWEVYK